MPNIEHWSANDPAVWLERVDDQTIAVRHPTYPAEATWTDGDPDTLKQIVTNYLAKVENALGLPGLLDGSGAFALPLAWLPLRPDTDGSSDPRASFLVTRYGDPTHDDPVDRTTVFLAVESTAPNDEDRVLGSRLGIRVVAHVSNLDQRNVRITSAARSAELPKALVTRSHSAVDAFLGYYFNSTNFNTIKFDIGRAAGLSPHAPFGIDGVRVRDTLGGLVFAEVYANIPRPEPEDDPDALPYALTTAIVYDPAEPSHRVVTVERFSLVAHAVDADLFPQDPASMAGVGHLIEVRPNRAGERLKPWRKTVTLVGIDLDGMGHTHLHDNLNLVKVTRSKLVNENADESLAEVVKPTDVTDPRMNAFAALSGYQRARALFNQHEARPLFETIFAYGLSPFQYFKFAARPLLVRYRARIRPGPGKDGKTVNAQVDFDPHSCDLVGLDALWDPSKRRPLQVRFALADLQRSASRRQPLGLTVDPRWSWHEYCHVLLAARTGLLELRFAHSAGDALAAITGDPWSKLSSHPWLRGYTFPWVYLHRRHDRSVYDGWSWNGRYHRPASFDPIVSNCRQKGYQSEQILSTSLFRLYRALGGDTVLATGAPDRPARQRAADYTVYLILLVIRFLPPALWSVIETPDQLVSKLIAADIGTWPVGAGPLKDRVGGWAHKVVRWAFEAQGLYATTDPLAVIDAPGKPHDVDVFIDNGRPNAEGDFPRGGYMPVSLDWHAAPGLSPWHASPSAIQIDGGNQAWVEVRNRGQSAATGVTVRVWWIEWPAADVEPPKWDPVKWTALGPTGPKPVPPWPTMPAVSFGPFALPPQPPGTRRLILAAATCAADRANNDPATSLPCASQPTPIVDLVAGDNNLGLRLREVP